MSMPIRWNLNKNICDAYEKQGSKSSALHGHHHFLITLITGGVGTQVLNGKEILFEPGDLFLLSPTDFHENRVEPGTSYDHIGVKFSYGSIDSRLWAFWGNDRFPMHTHLSQDSAVKIRHVMERLIYECQNESHNTASEMMLTALLEELIVLVIREFPSTVGSGADDFTARTLAFLHSNFRNPLTVSDAAENAGYTPNYFNTVFRQRFGLPFGIYLKKLRLSYAKNLLLSGDSPLTEIAFEAGFCSLSHFSRTFSAEYGASPMEYRRINKPQYIPASTGL